MKSPFLNDLYEFMLFKRYSKRTVSSYMRWINHYIDFHKQAHPKTLSAKDVREFLTHLAVTRQLSAATQAQALNALNFLYTKFLEQPLGNIGDFKQPQKNETLPVVLTQDEVTEVLNAVPSRMRLPVSLMYGSGLRRIEVVRLRVGDIDFDQKVIRVHYGKGNKYRTTTLSLNMIQGLKQQIQQVQILFDMDKHIPCLQVVDNPYQPSTETRSSDDALRWQYLFPSTRLSIDPETGYTRRHHIDESAINKTVRKAVAKLGINKPVSSHTLRHSFATHLLEHGVDIHTVQKQLGLAHIEATDIYRKLVNRNSHQVASPINNVAVEL